MPLPPLASLLSLPPSLFPLPSIFPSLLPPTHAYTISLLSFCDVAFVSSSLSSLELAPAYEKAKEAQDKATANSTENMQNKREIAKEFKAYKEHKSEATKLTKLRKEKVSGFIPFSVGSREGSREVEFERKLTFVSSRLVACSHRTISSYNKFSGDCTIFRMGSRKLRRTSRRRTRSWPS